MASRTKQKILDVLDSVLDDISEDRLLDILLDAYTAQKQAILDLAVENAAERENLRLDREHIRQELHKMRNDPLYGAAGEYFFEGSGTVKRRFCIMVRGHAIEMIEQLGGVDYRCRQMERLEWVK
jgi:hypothetical protein